jgi:hypothetical protein
MIQKRLSKAIFLLLGWCILMTFGGEKGEAKTEPLEMPDDCAFSNNKGDLGDCKKTRKEER